MGFSNSAEPMRSSETVWGYDPTVMSSLAQIHQTVTRDPALFRPQLEPASKLCSRPRSSVLVSCHGLQCSFGYAQGFILMSLVEVTLFLVCPGSDTMPSFTLEVLAPPRCSVWLLGCVSTAVPRLSMCQWTFSREASEGLALLEDPSEWKAWNANVIFHYYHSKSQGLIVRTAPDGQSWWEPCS